MALKSTAEVKDELARCYERLWAEEAAGCGSVAWPLGFSLGRCSKKELEDRFVEVCERADELRSLAATLGLGLEHATRIVCGTKQTIPVRLTVGSMDLLAGAARRKQDFACARRRATRLSRDFPQLGPADVARLLREMRRSVPEDVDFDLACRAGAWFAQNDARGLTARQVPLEGFHAKWLDAAGRRSVVARLAGLDELPLAERPAQVRFTYLDPDYLARGLRRHDSWVVGDACALPYEPQVVVICENRDTALWFGQVEGGLSVMGDGFAAINNLPRLAWVGDAPLVVYWGDMDAAGLEILDGCRQAGIDCKSMLMDIAAYERYRAFGTATDAHGRALAPKEPRPTPCLSPAERELYLRLCDPAWTGPRRIEQERIPLSAALAALLDIREKA